MKEISREPVPVPRTGRDPAASLWRPLVTSRLTGETSVRDLASTVYEHRWLAVGTAAGILALAALYLLWAPRVYETRAVVQVEEESRTLAGLEEVSELLSERRASDAEIAIMRSEVILGDVVDELRLDLEAAPRRSVLDAFARRAPDAAIRLQELSVPDPLVERPLTLVARGDGRYALLGEDDRQLAEGVVGQRATADLRDLGGAVTVVVAELVGEPGSEFTVRRRDRGEVIDELRKRIQIEEEGKNSGIIDLTLAGPDPERIAAILRSLTSRYLRQNVERKSAQAENTLAFLEQQLPVLKRNVEEAEARLESFQEKRGTNVSLSRNTEAMLDRAVDVERDLAQLELEAAELRQRFTENHPAIGAISQKIAKMRAIRAQMEGSMRAIPAAEIEGARLTRDHKLASQLYDVVLNKAQELRITRSGIVGNVRILDHARAPRRPASPNPSVVLTIGLLLALGTGVGAALLRRALDVGADDPDEIEARVGLPVYVTIPHSDRQAALSAEVKRGRPAPPLVLSDPGDPAVEGVRSLRTALQFALIESPNNVIAVGSPAPGVGKSFVSANLAILMAGAGNRVLLVDADLRRGGLHRIFGADRAPGLSDVLTGNAKLEASVRTTDVSDRLDLLSTGRIPPNPAELLASARFQDTVRALSPRYDFILVDTPPVLAVTDSVLVARCTGVNLLVLRAGEHPYRDIALAVRQFTQAGFVVQGAILNDAHSTRHGYGRYGRYYEYRSQRS